MRDPAAQLDAGEHVTALDLFPLCDGPPKNGADILGV
jgi:hypothetical protein